MDIRNLDGLEGLWEETTGDPEILVAVLDGPVDESHRCFDGADLTRINSLVIEEGGLGPMSAHGTHVASIIFGRHNSPACGIAPQCRGLTVPIY
jgi:subtilisin family serine protease